MSDSRHKNEVVSVQEIEGLLERLPGVLGARMVVNDWGAIEEIHVLAVAERNPKQVVRDVESSLAARWGISVDHKKVSVAQLKAERSAPQPVRLKIMHVSLTTDASNERVEAKVVLGKTADEHFTQEGVASGGNSAAESRRALAQATLQAVNQLLQANYTFALDEIAVLTVGQREIILAVVSLLTPRNNEETLVGAVLQKGDSSASVVKAVLDAINRRFGKVALYPKPNVQSD